MAKTVAARTITTQLEAALKLALSRTRITASRLRQLRAYTRAICAPLEEHVQVQALTTEELIAVLVAAALYEHKKDTQKVNDRP